MTDAAYTPLVSNEPVEGRPLPPAAMWQADAEVERVDREAGYYGASRGLALRETFNDAQITGRLFGYLDAENRRSFDDQQARVFGEGSANRLSAEEANATFGVPGRLSFDAPVNRNTAAWRQSLAQREAFRDDVVANSDTPWWQLMGAGLAGSILDPAGLPLWMAPELATGRALEGAFAATRLARLGRIGGGVARGAIEGAAGGVVYEGANLWLHHEASDDYDLGDATANVLFGAGFGGVVGGLGGWWAGRGAHGPREPRVPAVVESLPEASRPAAFADAVGAVIEDRPVDMGPGLLREAEARTSGRMPREMVEGLDEAPGEGALTPRWVEDAGLSNIAVTPRGLEVPVRYAVVEADELITSHDDDLFKNGEYPTALQPRQRDRAGAQARNRALEAELNPKRLMGDVGAETGAPIVSRDGVVESGNGRGIAIRRSYRNGTPAARRYRAELEARGYDVGDMEAPVLVRVRQGDLNGADRVKLTRDMNAEATEAYSPSERAVADAAGLDDDLLGMLDGSDLNAAGNRRFVRGFMDRVASDDMNRMTTADGRLSEAGLDRISAAMVARAYGDRGLVEALFEATDSNIKALGRALAEASPDWAGMRGAIARGEAPAELDPTASLTAAVNFVRHVRAGRGSVEEAMDLVIGQYDAFTGAAMTPETEAFVRSFFRTSAEGVTLWKSPRSAASLANGLRWLAGEIRKAEPGPNLFGETADAATGRQLLDAFGQWFRKSGDEGGLSDIDLFGAGRAGNDSPDGPAGTSGRDVRPDGDTDARVVGRQGAGEGAEKPRVAKGEKPKPPKGDPYADPEIAALASDTEAALLRAGLDPADIAAATPPAQDPQTVADAIAAGVFCLKGSAA